MDTDTQGATPVASAAKRTVRKLLLWLLAIPAVIAGGMLALPLILPDDPELHLGEAQHDKMLMILGGSVVAFYVVHLLTKSWGRSNGT